MFHQPVYASPPSRQAHLGKKRGHPGEGWPRTSTVGLLSPGRTGAGAGDTTLIQPSRRRLAALDRLGRDQDGLGQLDLLGLGRLVLVGADLALLAGPVDAVRIPDATPVATRLLALPDRTLHRSGGSYTLCVSRSNCCCHHYLKSLTRVLLMSWSD